MLTFRTYALRKLVRALSPRMATLLVDYLAPRRRTLPLPSTLTLDVCNACNLACPLCATGRGVLGRPPAMLSYAAFRSVVDRTSGLRYLNLFDWGEPLLNPDLFAMLRHATARGIRTNLHSNFSVALGDPEIELLVTSGLTDLVLSVDGIRQESYEMYRRGGSVALVRDNLGRLLEARRRHRSRTPNVTWKLLENVHNAPDVPRIAALCRELGIAFHRRHLDTRRTVDDANRAPHIEPPSRWLTPEGLGADPPDTVTLLSGRCFHLWFRPVVRPDLGVAPCCNVSRIENDFGDLHGRSLAEVWNNERFRYARSLFTPRPEARPRGGVICERCDLAIAYRQRLLGRPALQEVATPDGGAS